MGSGRQPEAEVRVRISHAEVLDDLNGAETVTCKTVERIALILGKENSACSILKMHGNVAPFWTEESFWLPLTLCAAGSVLEA